MLVHGDSILKGHFHSTYVASYLHMYVSKKLPTDYTAQA